MLATVNFASVTILLFYTLVNTLIVTSQECTTGELRTVPGNNSRDYPQYCLNGEWRRMCTGGGTWGDSTVTVACRQLGYSGHMSRGNACYETDTNGEVRLSAPCDGTENRLQDCGQGIVEHECSCNSQAFLECRQSNCTDEEIRLVGGSTNREGRVEVCMDGRWGTVCNKSQKGVGEAVCSQLLFPGQGATAVSTFGPGFVPIRNCTVQTGGDLKCNLITDASCDHSMDLGVVCRTYKQLYNELLAQQSSNNTSPTCTTCPTVISESTSCPTYLPVTAIGSGSTPITALGAVTGVLLVLLLGTVTALVVMCMKRIKDGKSRDITNQARDRTLTEEQYVVVGNIAENPAYEAVKSSAGEESSYEVINS